MSTIIDERVVEMRFDNKHFESNVATSMSSINKLKQNLDLSGASKGLSSISPAIGDTRKSLEGLEYASYKTGFRWSDVVHKISSTAEWRMARNAVDHLEQGVKNLANSLLGLTAMKTGFNEYGTQMGAIQTILANTKKEGTSLEDVNGALDELNAYADKTIYNFTEMTKNIGTFTAAGVKLDTSVQAIKGIANLAAVSGSTSQQASTAMYQLSQAMASGTVKLMDWNSVVNAGMGGQVFQDALKETARVHGIAIDDIISKNGSFRESLQEGWLTTEILTDTLAKFTGDLTEEQLKAQGYTDEQIKGILELGDTANKAATEVKTFTQLMDTLEEAAQSGWSQTWRILVGDFEEAKELFSEVSEVIGGMIGASAESRNELLENWKVLGGREDIINSISNVFWGLMDVLKPIKEAFREIFPPLTAEQLKKFTQGLEDLTSRFKLSEKTSNNLKRTFKGLFAVLKIAGQILGGVFKVVGAVLGVFGDILSVVFGLTGGIGDLVVGFSNIIDEGNLISKLFTGIAKIVKTIGKVVTTLFKFITKVFAFPGLEIFAALLDGIYEKLTRVRDSSDGFGSGFAHAFEVVANAIMNNPIVKFLGSVLKGLKTLFVGIFKALGNVLGELGHKIANADIMGLLEIMNEIIAGGAGIQLIKWLKNLGGAKGGLSDLIDSFDDLLGSLGGALEGLQNKLNAQALKDIAVAIAILAASLLVLSLIDGESLTDASAAIIVLFSGLMGSLSILSKSSVGGLDIKGIAESTARIYALGKVMTALATAVLILSAALFIIGKMDTDEVIRGLIGVTGLMFALAFAVKIMQTTSSTLAEGGRIFSKSSSVAKNAIQLVAVAVACKMLADVLIDVAKLSWKEMGIGAIGMFACMATLVGAMKILPLGTKNIGRPFWKFCAQLIVVAKAAGVLADVLIDLSVLDWDELKIGGLGMIGCMIALVAAMKVLATITDTVDITDKSIKAKEHNFIGMAAALLALGLAIRIMTPALEEFAMMDWDELGRAGSALGGLLVFFALFAGAVKLFKPEGLIQAAGSILIISTSMLILAGACKLFAMMEWGELGRAAAVLGGLLAFFTLFTLIAKIAKPGNIAGAAASLTILAVSLSMLIPPLLALSLMSWETLKKGAVVLATLVGALLLLSLVRNTIMTFGDVFVSSSTSFIAMATSMVILAAALNLLIVPLIALSQISWETLKKGGWVLAAMVGALALLALISKIAAPGILALSGALALLSLSLGLIGGGIALLGVGLTLLGSGLAAFVGAFVIILKELLAAVEVVLVGIVDLIKDFVVSILRLITDVAGELGTAIMALISMVCDVLVDGVPPLVDAILQVVSKVLKQLVKYAPGIVETLAELLVKVIKALAKYIGPLVSALIDIIIAVIDGIAARAPELIESFVNLFASIFNALGSALKGVDSDTMLNAVLSFGAIALLMKTFASVSGFGLAALKGVLLCGIIFAEIAALIAVIGAIGQIPGFTWLIKEGGKVLEAVGTAIGQFIGGIVGGFAQGMSGSLPAIADNLSSFMTKLTPFLDGIKTVDASVLKGAGILSLTVITMTAGGLLSAIATIATGGFNLASYLLSVVTIGKALRLFSEEVSGVDVEAVKVGANAAGPLTTAVLAMTGTSLLSGLVTLATCGINLASYALSVSTIGSAMKSFSEEVSGIDTEAVKTGANAAGPLTTAVLAMTGTSLLSGLTTLATCGINLASYVLSVTTIGQAMKSFSEEVSGIDTEAVKVAANAAEPLNKAVASMTGAGLLAGLTTLATCGINLLSYETALKFIAKGMMVFSEEVSGIDTEAVKAGANAAGSVNTAVLAMTGTSLLSGLVTLATAGINLGSYLLTVATIGQAMKSFSEEVKGIDLEAVKAGANAAGPLTTAVLAMTGTSLLSGLVTLATCGINLLSYTASAKYIGASIKAFSNEVSGIDPEAVRAGADAAKPLHSAILAMTGTSLLSGLVTLVTCGLNFASYKGSAECIGASMKAFSNEVKGIDPEAVKAAANAAGPLTSAVNDMTSGGVFSALSDILSNGADGKNFKTAVVAIGSAIASFSEQVKNVDPENVSAASVAAEKIAHVVTTLPSSSDGLTSFGTNLTTFGTKLKTYFDTASTITSESISASDNVITAIKTIAGTNSGDLVAVADGINSVTKSIKDLGESLKSSGKESVKKFKEAFDDLPDDMKKEGKKAIEEFVDGVEDKQSKAKKAATKIAEKCIDELNDQKKGFKSAGKNVATSFADGISENTFKAKAKAKAMAEAALEAARKALAINSPSKVFRALGYSVPEGFAVGIDKFAWMATDSSIAMTDSAIDSVKNGISRIADAVNSDIDTQPTIRPVLDLSDVKSGANAIGGMFGSKSLIGVTAKVGSIATSMNQRNQNGGNAELLSAINGLRKDIRNNPSTTTIINGVTYDDGSNIKRAAEDIVRAARIERRM